VKTHILLSSRFAHNKTAVISINQTPRIKTALLIDYLSKGLTAYFREISYKMFKSVQLDTDFVMNK